MKEVRNDVAISMIYTLKFVRFMFKGKYRAEGVKRRV